MLTKWYVIKIGEWFYSNYRTSLTRDLDNASKYVHVDNAKYEIEQMKLEDAIVYEVTYKLEKA